jgi:hypothetical protein
MSTQSGLSLESRMSSAEPPYFVAREEKLLSAGNCNCGLDIDLHIVLMDLNISGSDRV